MQVLTSSEEVASRCRWARTLAMKLGEIMLSTREQDGYRLQDILEVAPRYVRTVDETCYLDTPCCLFRHYGL